MAPRYPALPGMIQQGGAPVPLGALFGQPQAGQPEGGPGALVPHPMASTNPSSRAPVSTGALPRSAATYAASHAPREPQLSSFFPPRVKPSQSFLT